ncbi:hypothetical protein JR316_0004415 [Psilocybe cubensis]|uniref:Uncharacterized protein n=2 Tax=Psilocybe cubensis TaxID=181762 RepID=A0A8H7Y0F1_PSICU|nr:hypothetical protein JR316_0004415 [Psilocybe cubensis]KAH9482317.1 hypothetical protein JR316_0004415 [Psilocybe cubensis]
MADCDYARFTTRSGRAYALCRKVAVYALQLPAAILAAMQQEAATDVCFASEQSFTPVPAVCIHRRADSGDELPYSSPSESTEALQLNPSACDPSSTSKKRKRVVDEPPYSSPSDSTEASQVNPSACDPSSTSKKRKRAAGVPLSRHLRSIRREEEFAAHGHGANDKRRSKIATQAAVEGTDLGLKELPAANGAYEARREEECEGRAYTLDEAKALGLKVFHWDGRQPVAFVAPDDTVFMVLAGRPNDADYDAAASRVYEAFRKESDSVQFTGKYAGSRRGVFSVINVGVSRGQGLAEPVYLGCHSHEKLVSALLKNKDVQRMASYASAAFATWAPRTYNYYKTQLDKLFHHMNHLPRIFRRSIFPAAAFNLGPSVVTFRHRDMKNCPFGMCSIQALGKFDPTKGGHLIVWELGLIIKFPAGSTILLPSATLSHSNVTIGKDEERASFTQFCHGGLFRWVDYGFQTEKSLCESNPTLYAEVCRLRPQRWQVGLNLLSTLDELKCGGFDSGV